ncbi:cytoplasmic protein [Candidatus Berkelbacteria bacterium CG_4_8_14_3_um_filter_42_13]|uniref:Cytoplasmic protein n=1 Tax=Candidatus Berkelbacteria bacterium CG_4_8_14_3_um_filter_42_13 TaxID=1974505 RepID=A0A2M7K1I7_9BACT|nr:MAG: cytoplasmic protein [Candidatus Berkelbacteria bacterium CG_4_8_14_3_um_filter_42_13]
MEIIKIQNRLKRIEGQVRGVEEMVSILRPTDDIIIQLSAIRSAVDSLIISIIEDEIDQANRDRLLELKRTLKRMIKS